MIAGEKTCAHCGSEDVLPYEDDEPVSGDYSIWVIMITGVLLLLGYFTFMVSTYLYFPAAIFIFIIISAWVVNRSDERNKKKVVVEKDWLCLECDRSFMG